MSRYASAALAFLVLTVVSAGAAAEYKLDGAQARIDHIDTSHAPLVKIFVTLLSENLKPASVDQVQGIEVRLHRGDDSKGEEIKVFEDGQAVDGGDGDVLPLAESDEQFDAIVVVSGHQAPELAYGTLGQDLKDAVSKILAELPGTGRANVIWYHDQLETFVQRPNRTDELSVLSHVNVAELCRKKSFDDYVRWGLEPEPNEDGEGEGAGLREHPCAPTGDFARLGKIVEGKAYRGFFPKLLGLAPLPPCGDVERRRPIGARHQRAENDVRGFGGAIDEALRALVTYGEPGRPKRLIVLSDGKDGYLEDQDDCRAANANKLASQFRAARKECKRDKACKKEARAARESGQERSEAELKQRLALAQQRFRDEKLLPWIALARAADVQVYAIGLPNGEEHELERLEVLALRTGGTYRTPDETGGGLAEQVDDLLMELGGGLVISFDSGLKEPSEPVAFSVTLHAREESGRKGKYGTKPFPLRLEASVGGPLVMAENALYWLEGLVGSPWHVIVAIAAVLVALLLLFVLFKLIKALVKKIVGKGAKKAGKAAKKRAKVKR